MHHICMHIKISNIVLNIVRLHIKISNVALNIVSMRPLYNTRPHRVLLSEEASQENQFSCNKPGREQLSRYWLKSPSLY
jgi:hypothetical protein